MKHFIMALVFIAPCYFSHAQEDSISYKEFQQKIIEQLKTDTALSFNLPHNFAEKSFRIYTPDYLTFQKTKKHYRFNMPVARGGFGFNMPVYVPDSTVQYYIREKKISAFNPLDKKNSGN